LMVNHDMIFLNHSKEGSEARFKTEYRQKIFIILLLDFLSPADKYITGRGVSYLQALAEICESPQFNINASINLLNSAVNNFSEWLDTEIDVYVWSSNINKETTLNLSRKELIYICGNITKHSFSRLSKVLNKIQKIFLRCGETLSLEECLLALEDCYDRFFYDVISYRSSSIIEQINNIRWGIHEYLTPQYTAAITYENGNPPRYSYKYPKELNNRFARNCYWGLLNNVRSTPFVDKFKTYDVLSIRY